VKQSQSQITELLHDSNRGSAQQQLHSLNNWARQLQVQVSKKLTGSLITSDEYQPSDYHEKYSLKKLQPERRGVFAL